MHMPKCEHTERAGGSENTYRRVHRKDNKGTNQDYMEACNRDNGTSYGEGKRSR